MLDSIFGGLKIGFSVDNLNFSYANDPVETQFIESEVQWIEIEGSLEI